jgi:hypothetical protein
MPEQTGHFAEPAQVLHTTATTPLPPQIRQAAARPAPRHAVHRPVPEQAVHLIRVFVPQVVHCWRTRWVILPAPPQVMHRIGM